MEAGEESSNGGKVTIRELYKMMLEQNDQRHAMELRIMEKLDAVAACTQTMETRIANNTKEIDALRTVSNRNDVVAGIAAAIAGAVAGIWGGKQ